MTSASDLVKQNNKWILASPQTLSSVYSLYQSESLATDNVLQNHRLRTGHRPPTTDHRPTNSSSNDLPTTDPPASALPTKRPTDKWPTDPPTTDSSTGSPPNQQSLTPWPYYKWPTTLWLTNLTLTESPLDLFFQQLISICHSE